MNQQGLWLVRSCIQRKQKNRSSAAAGTRPFADKPLADQPLADRNKPLADKPFADKPLADCHLRISHLRISHLRISHLRTEKILFITKKIHIINPYKKLITNEKKRESLSIANFKKKFYPSHLEKISQRQKLHKKRKLIKFMNIFKFASYTSLSYFALANLNCND
jgi:hypothetical protein